MAEPFLGEIRMMAFNFAPSGWAYADGQILNIAQNQALYALIGTYYGGNGTSTFALPDLRGRTPIHVSAAHRLAQAGGEAAHGLTEGEIPAHTHVLMASSNGGTSPAANGNVLAKGQDASNNPVNYYAAANQNLVEMVGGSVRAAGGGGAHPNLQPYVTLAFCIALQGIFPSRN